MGRRFSINSAIEYAMFGSDVVTCAGTVSRTTSKRSPFSRLNISASDVRSKSPAKKILSPDFGQVTKYAVVFHAAHPIEVDVFQISLHLLHIGLAMAGPHAPDMLLNEQEIWLHIRLVCS